MSQSPDSSDLEALRKAYHTAIDRSERPFVLDHAFPLPADLAALHAQLTALKGYLDEFRPFDPFQVEKLHEVFDTEYTYHSNRIEGNTLTLRETDLVVNKGITIGGKSVREHFEAVNHAQAVNRIRELTDRGVEITERVALDLHGLIMLGIDYTHGGRYREERVRIQGSQHVPPHQQNVPALMAAMYAWFDANKATLHPVQLAAEMHEKLATIHPFRDGNGRTSRLLMNLILLRNGYPVTVISSEQRMRYYDMLEQANLSDPIDNSGFQRFVAENVRTWLIKYLDMITVNGSGRNTGKGRGFLAAIAPHFASES